MHIEQLPLEALVNIFSDLNSSRRLQCALVCKTWKEPALKLLHQNLKLGDRHRSLLKRLLKLDTKERDDCFKYGAHVKTLQFVYSNKKYMSSLNRSRCGFNSDASDSDFENYTGGFDYDFDDYDSDYDAPVEFNEKEFMSLMEYFPNLLILDVAGNKLYKRYFRYLLDSKSDKCLNQIQVITAPNMSIYNPGSYNAHFNLCCRYCETITSLEIQDYCDNMDMGYILDIFPRSTQTLLYLEEFPKLKSLKILRGSATSITPFRLQEACPNLTSLNFGIHSYMVQDPKNFLPIDPAFQIKQNDLESLILGSTNIPVEYIQYLIECNFTQLNTLKLIMSRVDLYTWINKIGLENVLKLARRLSTLDYTELSFYPMHTIRDRPEMKETKMTTFFRLVNAFKGKKNTFCTIDIADEGKQNLADRMMYDPVNGLRLFYGLEHSTNDLPEENRVIKRKTITSTSFVLPNISISGIGLEIINNFNVTIYNTGTNYMFLFVQYALVNCPNLEILNVVMAHRFNHYITIGRDAKHSYLTKQKHHLTATTTKKNLKSIRTRCITPDPSFYRMIGHYLPGIETIVCTDYVGYNKRSIPGTFDLLAFKNLKTFYFDTGFVSPSKIASGYVRFNYTDGSAAMYYCSSTSFRAEDDDCIRKNAQRHMLTIECEKNIRIIVGTKALCGDVIAEIENGILLDYVHIDSHICNKY